MGRAVISDLRRSLDAKAAENAILRKKLKQEKAALAQATQTAKAAREAADIIQAVAQTLQQQVHEQIGVLVSRCLAGVFGDGAYECRAVCEKKRGKTETRLVFVRDGKEVDPVDSAGGGTLDVAAFALRVARLLLSRPPMRRLLVLDEPLKHLSASYRPNAVSLIETLAEEFDLQVILVTHSREFQVGKVIYIGDNHAGD